MNIAVLLAAGKGKRSGSPDKLWEVVAGKPLWRHAFEALVAHRRVDKIAIAAHPDRIDDMKNSLAEFEVQVVAGGESRHASLKNVLEKIEWSEDDNLIVHNAANPFLTADEIDQVIDGAELCGAAGVGHIAVDTVKRLSGRSVIETLERAEIGLAQTPQALRGDVWARIQQEGVTGTDEMSLAEQVGVTPVLLPADERNFKVTTAHDLEKARWLLAGLPEATRTGIGLDSHRFDDKQEGLKLGGVLLKDQPQMIANSDGDVILHALGNALLQAIGAGSLGTVADPLCEDGVTDSAVYLNVILEKVRAAGYRLVQAGIQLEGRRPTIDPLSDQIKTRLSELLHIAPSQIGLTATTGEDLTAFGRGEGLQCWATVVLTKIKA
jgi:2-C-methyl-D-erythritol 4-phosphate cytidylyltransferase/2-C-methyl-D-erythritol 2,4-cyclodiphosphate synthase